MRFEIAILTITSPIVISVPTRGLLAVETKVLFIKITTHLNLQDMFRSCNDHVQLKVELI